MKVISNSRLLVPVNGVSPFVPIFCSIFRRFFGWSANLRLSGMTEIGRGSRGINRKSWCRWKWPMLCIDRQICWIMRIFSIDLWIPLYRKVVKAKHTYRCIIVRPRRPKTILKFVEFEEWKNRILKLPGISSETVLTILLIKGSTVLASNEPRCFQIYLRSLKETRRKRDASVLLKIRINVLVNEPADRGPCTM